MGIMQFLSPNASRSKKIIGSSKLVGRLSLYLILNFLLEISNELVDGACRIMINQLHCSTTQRHARPGSYRYCRPRVLSVTALGEYRDGSAPRVDERDRPFDGRGDF
jgi:hypothetical protein